MVKTLKRVHTWYVGNAKYVKTFKIPDDVVSLTDKMLGAGPKSMTDVPVGSCFQVTLCSTLDSKRITTPCSTRNRRDSRNTLLPDNPFRANKPASSSPRLVGSATKNYQNGRCKKMPALTDVNVDSTSATSCLAALLPVREGTNSVHTGCVWEVHWRPAIMNFGNNNLITWWSIITHNKRNK